MIGSVYGELQDDLQTSTMTVSWIISSMSIGYIISNIVCGYIADRIQEIHRVQSLVIGVCSLCVMAVPFITNITAMFLVFASIGIGWAANETHFTLFVFRLYPLEGTRMYFLVCIIVIIFSGITPIAVQFSLSLTGSYTIPFVAFGLIGLSHSVLILLLPTPKHDEHRSLKRTASKSPNACHIEGDESIQSVIQAASSKLDSDPQYDRLRNMTVFLLILTMGIHGMTEKGTLAFITTYCVDHLEIDQKYGRYMMSAYYYAIILYRVLRHFLFPHSSLALHILAAFGVRIVLMVIFVFIGNQTWILFTLYGSLGFCSSVVLPGLCAYAELSYNT